MFSETGRLLSEIFGENGEKFRQPGDMTRLHNGDFAVKVIFSSLISCLTSRIVLSGPEWHSKVQQQWHVPVKIVEK